MWETHGYIPMLHLSDGQWGNLWILQGQMTRPHVQVRVHVSQHELHGVGCQGPANMMRPDAVCPLIDMYEHQGRLPCAQAAEEVLCEAQVVVQDPWGASNGAQGSSSLGLPPGHGGMMSMRVLVGLG